MTPNELYNQPVKKKDNDLSVLAGVYFNHMPELDGIINSWELENIKQERIEIWYYVNHNFDHRRIWRLAAVTLDNYPFMIIQNAGREGDDHYERFITDYAVYQAAVTYIKTFAPPILFRVNECEIVDPNHDIKNLTDFYGNEWNTVEQEHY
jgi:hypothetical protein